MVGSAVPQLVDFSGRETTLRKWPLLVGSVRMLLASAVLLYHKGKQLFEVKREELCQIGFNDMHKGSSKEWEKSLEDGRGAP